ncbi:MAG: YdbH domain-containing protein [Alphaproteobacteria bacterium]|nr:YdbH domain-containing protein [Alphaproteobacteria bacterium]
MSITALALTAGLLAAVFALPTILAAFLPEVLRQAGFKDVSLTVLHLSWDRLELEAVSLDQAVSAKRLTITFSPFGLTGLEAKNLNLKAKTDGKSLRLGHLVLPFAGNAQGDDFNLPHIKLDQARFDLDTQMGPVRGILNSEHEGAATRLRLELSSGAKPALFQPLILTGLLTAEGPELSFVGRLNDPMHRLVIGIKGHQNQQTAAGEAKIDLKRIEFDQSGLQPHDLFPILEPFLKDVSGPFEGQAQLAWQNGKVTSQANLHSHGLSFESQGAAVRNLMGTLSLNRLWPLRTPAPQSFSFGMLSAGAPLGSGAVAFSLEDDGSIFFKRAVLNLADGKLRLDPVRIDPDLNGTLNFQASNVHLSSLAPLFQIEGIALDGIVDGVIPVHLTRDGMKIIGAKLSARDKGFVRYRPANAPATLQDSQEGVSLMMAALKDFRYDSLALGLDGQAGGETTVTFQIKGRNPGLHNGVPFELNFRLSGPLDRLAKQAYGIISLPEQIEAALAETNR